MTAKANAIGSNNQVFLNSTYPSFNLKKIAIVFFTILGMPVRAESINVPHVTSVSNVPDAQTPPVAIDVCPAVEQAKTQSSYMKVRNMYEAIVEKEALSSKNLARVIKQKSLELTKKYVAEGSDRFEKIYNLIEPIVKARLQEEFMTQMYPIYVKAQLSEKNLEDIITIPIQLLSSATYINKLAALGSSPSAEKLDQLMIEEGNPEYLEAADKLETHLRKSPEIYPVFDSLEKYQVFLPFSVELEIVQALKYASNTI